MATKKVYRFAKILLLLSGIIYMNFKLLWHVHTSHKMFNSLQQITTPASPSYRIQLSSGTCIGSSNDSALQVIFCDPTKQDFFKFEKDGRLVYGASGKCIQNNENINISSSRKCQLVLGDCTKNVLEFILYNNSFLQVKDPETENFGKSLCLTHLKPSNKVLGSEMGLQPCDKNLAKVTLIEESEFLVKRRALLKPVHGPQQINCDFPACAINGKVKQARLLHSEITRCTNLSSCVTIVTKTARRPHLVIRMAQSMRDIKGYDLPIIAYDDGGDPYPDNITRQLEQFPNLRYIIDEREDLGISLGRNLAIEQVETKYLFLVDDDTVFIKDKTDIALLAEMLDSTDLSLVGGTFSNMAALSGLILFQNEENKRVLYITRDTCTHDIDAMIERFPSCFMCDITPNVFMAKTRDILKVGGWSGEIKVFEHKDIFVKLKAENKKVAYCPDIQVVNQQEETATYSQLRYKRQRSQIPIFKNIWNIHAVIERTDERFERIVKEKINRLNASLEIQEDSTKNQ